jgi:hypothetical protein
MVEINESDPCGEQGSVSEVSNYSLFSLFIGGKIKENQNLDINKRRDINNIINSVFPFCSTTVELKTFQENKIFEIKKISEIEKMKELLQKLLQKKRNKVGHLTEEKSTRPSNLEDMIVRNLIQDIIPFWINWTEKDEKKHLKKIKPSYLKSTHFFNKNKNKKIEYIYKLGITKKEESPTHNINIIEKAANDKSIKLSFTLMEVFTAFKDIDSREEILISKIPSLKYENEKERKTYVEKFYLGLKSKEEYISEKGGTEEYQNDLMKKINELS